MPQLLSSAPRALRAHRRTLERRLRDDSGQSLIELALVLPMFFALMIGFINVCMVTLGLCSISYACRRAGRYACLHSPASLLPVSQSTISAQVAPFVFNYPSNTYNATLTYSGTGNVVGGTAVVNVRITYTIVLPFVTIPAVTLSSTASGTIIQ
jgi:hypothetical protein